MSTATPTPTELSPPPIDPEALYEIVDGQYVEKSPVGIIQLWLATQFADVLKELPEVRARGTVLVEMMFDLRPTSPRSRRPDVSYVSFERWPRDRPLPDVNAWPVIPDLAVEIVSPTNMGSEVKKKTREYLAAGVRQVWVVYPETREIECYDAPTSVRIVESGGRLDASGLWPGVAIEVDRLLALPGAAAP
jgi:Uma2 family endonuclease